MRIDGEKEARNATRLWPVLQSQHMVAGDEVRSYDPPMPHLPAGFALVRNETVVFECMLKDAEQTQ